MAYNVIMAQVNTNTFGLGQSNTAWGFPVATNFHTILMSYWMCGPALVSGAAATIWPGFASANFFDFFPDTNSIVLTRLGVSYFYRGSLGPLPPAGTLMHILLSVDTHAQVIQVYINDVNVPVAGTWTGTPPFDFNITNSSNIWVWDVAGVITTGLYPAMADAWVSNTPSFVDLSNAANRRKFINRDLTPVDLGNTGTNPFGYQPAMYMSIRPGGVATDFLINRGVSGGSWNDPPVTLQAPGTCPLPPPPPAPPPRLAIDNVIVDATASLLDVNLVSLRWSDDRGHSWGSPVTQDIGEAGEYRTSLQWQRLAYARDRVFEISWSVPMRTALQGCWVDVTPAQS